MTGEIPMTVETPPAGGFPTGAGAAPGGGVPQPGWTPGGPVPPSGGSPVPSGSGAPGAGGGGRGSRRLGMALGGVGLVLLLVVVGFVVRGVKGSSAGAASPDDFVDRLAAAMTGVDPAAAIALLDPDELPGLGALYSTAVDQARKGADIDVPGALDALRVSVSGVEHRVSYLDSDHKYAKVTFLAGQVTADSDPSRLPEGVRKRLEDDGEPLEPETLTSDLTELRVESDAGKQVDPFLVLVDNDGRWYVSLGLTIGQYLVEVLDLPGGHYDDPGEIGPPASSPKEAIASVLDAAVDAANGGDGTGRALSGLVPEAQTRAFRIYGPSFADAFDPDERFEFGGPVFEDGEECPECGGSYEGLEVSTRKNGSLTYAVIDALTIVTRTQSCYYSIDDYDYGFGEDDGYYEDDEFYDDEFYDDEYYDDEFYDDGYYDDEFSDDGYYDDEFSDDGYYDDEFSNDRYGNQPGMDEPDSNGRTDQVDPSPNQPGVDPTTRGAALDTSTGAGVVRRVAQRPTDGDCTVETTTMHWDGECYDGTRSYSPEVDWFVTGDDEQHGCLTDPLDDDNGLTLADFGITDLHVVMSQERGGWVIDPIATIMDYGQTALSHLTDPKVKAALSD